MTTQRRGRHLFPAKEETLNYDADGNLLEDYRWTYTWDSENRLIQMVERSGDWQSSSRPAQRLSFSYDSHSRRIRKVVEEQSEISHQPSEIRNYEVVSDRRFLYDGWNLVAEFEMNLQHSSFALHTSYEWGLDLSGTEQGAGGVGGLLCISRATENGQRNTSLPTYDGNGNVLALYDLNSQTLTARYEYGPFGETLVAEGPAAAENAFRFSTKYTDEETGLLYYGFRYYSAELGRWPNRDPIGEKGGVNLYGMVGNNALNFVDRLGLSRKEKNDCEWILYISHGTEAIETLAERSKRPADTTSKCGNNKFGFASCGGDHLNSLVPAEQRLPISKDNSGPMKDNDWEDFNQRLKEKGLPVPKERPNNRRDNNKNDMDELRGMVNEAKKQCNLRGNCCKTIRISVDCSESMRASAADLGQDSPCNFAELIDCKKR